jgi:hypothetical protein
MRDIRQVAVRAREDLAQMETAEKKPRARHCFTPEPETDIVGAAGQVTARPPR